MKLRDNIRKIIESDGQKQAELIQQWKEEASANLKAMHEGMENALQETQMAGYRQYDKAAAFEKITGQPYGKSGLSWKKWAAAAVFTGLIALAGLFLVNHKPITHYAAVNGVKIEHLNDGTKVTLDQGSSLDYDGSRGVTVSGRAFFMVSKKADKTPFTVELNKGKVTVLGTRFSVSSYAGTTEVAVEEGRVKYEYGGREVILNAGDWMKLSGEDIVSSPILTGNHFSWTTQVLEFKNTPLDQALQDISRHYHHELVISKEIKSAGKCLLTSKFAGENLDQVMDELKLLFQIQYYKSGNRYVITSMKC
jgi:ferric-dicitrate binding protein FerR (iron transport regulator)